MSTMTLEQVRDAIRARPYVEDSIMLAWADAIDAHLAQPAQATTCAGCGDHKATPLRIDAMGGYVCLTCIDQKLSSLLGEFGYPEPQPAQAVDVGAIRSARALIDHVVHGEVDMQQGLAEAHDKLTRALSGEAGPVDGWQPIETAPKDGAAILVCTLGRQIDIATWDGKVWKDYAYGESCGASHWQPLPASPAPDKEG